MIEKYINDGTELTGKRLKVARLSKGLSRKELAKMLGVSEHTIGAYERNERIPSRKRMKDFAVFFGTSIENLFY